MFTQKVRHDRQSANRNVKKLGGTLWALKLEKKTVTIAEILGRWIDLSSIVSCFDNQLFS